MSLARLGRLIGVIVLMVGGAHVSAAQDAPPPRILLDQSPRAVDYQLRRLSDDQLLRVERRDDDQRYRPVYMAILLRAGLPRADRAEALAALARLSRASPVAVLLEALGHVPLDDQRSAEGLVAMMAEQPIDRFRDDRQIASDHLAQPDVPAPVMRGALAGLLAGGEPAASVWQLADARPGAVAALLQALSAFPPDRLDAMTPALGDRVEAVVRRTTADEPARVAAVQALARLRPHATTVSILAPLMARLHATNASVRIAWEPPQFHTLFERIRRGDVDLGCAPEPSMRSGLNSAVLFEEHFVLVTRKGHPGFTGSEDPLEAFCQWPHVFFGFRYPNIESVLEDSVARHGRHCLVRLSMPSFDQAADVISRSDMISVFPARLARLFGDRLQTLPLPVHLEGYRSCLYWDRGTEEDPGLRWLREEIRQVAHAAAAEAAAPMAA